MALLGSALMIHLPASLRRLAGLLLDNAALCMIRGVVFDGRVALARSGRMMRFIPLARFSACSARATSKNLRKTQGSSRAGRETMKRIALPLLPTEREAPPLVRHQDL